jgi:ketosteroid isomerase-like protein
MKVKALAAFLAVVSMLAVPGAISAQADDEAGSDVTAMVAEAVRMQQQLIERYNARKFEEMGAFWAEDAIALPPNHEPIRGRGAIVEYFRENRDTLGEGEVGPPLASSVSGNLVAVVPQYTGRQGQLRIVAHELFERQPDGSLLCIQDMFGFRDPLR